MGLLICVHVGWWAVVPGIQMGSESLVAHGGVLP